MLSSVTVPVFSTRNDQLIVSPRSMRKLSLLSVTVADLVSVGFGRCSIGVDTLDGWDGTALPSGAVAEAVAVLSTRPLSTSGCVTVYAVAVHVVEVPGASVVA